MARLIAEGYVAHLRTESSGSLDVLAATPSEARIPACPDWDADDLLSHLAEVQWFRGTVIAT